MKVRVTVSVDLTPEFRTQLEELAGRRLLRAEVREILCEAFAELVDQGGVDLDEFVKGRHIHEAVLQLAELTGGNALDILNVASYPNQNQNPDARPDADLM